MKKNIAQLDKNTKEIIHVWDNLKEISEYYNCCYYALSKAVDMKKYKHSMGYTWVSISKILNPNIKNTNDRIVLFKSDKFYKIYTNIGTLCREMCLTEELVKGLINKSVSHNIYSIKILKNNSELYFEN